MDRGKQIQKIKVTSNIAYMKAKEIFQSQNAKLAT
jgi:hypothetical protein